MLINRMFEVAVSALKALPIEDNNTKSGVDLGFTSMLGDDTQLTIMLERVLVQGEINLVAHAIITTAESDILMFSPPLDFNVDQVMYTSYDNLFAVLIESGESWNDSLHKDWKTAFKGNTSSDVCTVGILESTFDDEGEWTNHDVLNAHDENSMACIACVIQALDSLQASEMI